MDDKKPDNVIEANFGNKELTGLVIDGNDGGLSNSGGVYTSQISAARLENPLPVMYRLGKKPDGSLVLQGYVTWQQGWKVDGEWRTIPIVDITEDTPIHHVPITQG